MRMLAEAVYPAMGLTLSGMGVTESDCADLLGPATVEEHGDLALPCHSLAAVLRRSPMDIAEEVSLTLAPALAGIAKVSAVSGFVNLSAEPEWLAVRLSEPVSYTHLTLPTICSV